LIGELKNHLASRDHLVCAKPPSGTLYYYHLRNGLDCRMWFIPEEYPPEEMLAGPQSVFLVVNTYGGQTLESVLRDSGWSKVGRQPNRFALVVSNRFAAAYRWER
jgi:hypothetical protein